MNKLKYIVHPHAYIAFFIIISLFALIPNGLGWRGNMLDYTQNYVGLYLLYVFFYFIGYYLIAEINKPVKRKITSNMIILFYFVFLISLVFFILKFIYVGGIPLTNDSPYLRTKMGELGGFVDFPTKVMAPLGIVAFYLYVNNKKYLYFFLFLFSLILNILFAERSLIVFILVGAIVIYLHHYVINLKTFRIIISLGFLMLFFIGWVQISRLGGKDKLDLSGEKSSAEVAAWVVHGDLTGSQKFGAYVVDKLEGNRLYGRYTFGMYLALVIPDFDNHGAEYLQKEYTDAQTAQSAAIPYSYYMDFGYFSLLLPFFIGILSKIFYLKFKTLDSPFYTILYPIYFFSLLWSVRSGNFPIDPKFIYYSIVLIFIFKPIFYYKSNNDIILMVRLLYIFTLIVSILALFFRWN